MAFCDKEKQLIYDGYTCIDNKFFELSCRRSRNVREGVFTRFGFVEQRRKR